MYYNAPLLSLETARQLRVPEIRAAERYRLARTLRAEAPRGATPRRGMGTLLMTGRRPA